jgi:acyl-[acyl-carrier-protein] desaturase
MPGTGVPDFETHAKRLARAGVYDLAIHHEQVLLPIVVRHWRVEHLTGLKETAKRAQEQLMKYLDRLGKVARRLAEGRGAVPAGAGV